MNDRGDMYVDGDTLIATNLVYLENSHASFVEFQVDNSTQVDRFNGQNQVNIYPNPVKCDDEIYISSIDKIGYVRIISEFGSIIKCFTFFDEKSVKLDYSGMSSGFCIVEIETDKGKTNKKLIIK